MKHGSLFSGIGGFDLAAEWMGWENVFHCEWNEFGKKVLKYYWPNAISYHDITKTDFTVHRGTIDILTGGFPCQPFSLSGEQQGGDDERYLFPELLRAIREIKPRWVVGENVYGITTKKFRELFEAICTSMEAEGYKVQPVIIPASAVGAVHERERVWFIAYSGEKFSPLSIQQRRQNKTENTNADRKNESGSTSNTNSEGLPKWIQTGLESIPSKTGSFKRSEFTRAFAEGAWNEFPTQPPVFFRDDGISTRLDGITLASWRKQSCEAAGNAVVPQVVYQIFKAIEQCENPTP